MNAFKSNRESLAKLGITSSQSIQKHPFNAKNGFCIVWFALMTISEIMFIINEAKAAKEYVAIANSSLTLITQYIEFLLHVWKMQKLFEFIVNFEDLIQNRSERPESRLLYEKSIKQVEKCIETLTFAMMNVTLNLMLWPIVFSCYIKYFTTDLQGEAFQMPILMWLPFDWKNPFGYAVACAIIYITAFYGMSIMICQTCLIIGCYWLLIALGNDISHDLFTINATKVNPMQLKKELIKFIQIQSDTKRIVSNFLDAYEFNITAHFIWTILEICGYLLLVQFELSEDTVDISALIASIFPTIWTFALIFVYCDLGQRVSEVFDKPYDAICQFKFHLFPMDVQRMLPIVIVSVQQPIDLRGFGNISCTRDRFKRVVNGGFSYFMLLRAK